MTETGNSIILSHTKEMEFCAFYSTNLGHKTFVI